MPRDTNGVYTPLRDWQQDAQQGVPFSPDRWNAQDQDFADALNDLPLKTVVPTWVASGTDPATVNPGSLMEADGVIYVRPASQAIWLDISTPGLLSTDPFITQATALFAPLTHWHAPIESSTAPVEPVLGMEWRHTVSGAIYKRVSNGGNPIWQQIG